MTDNLVYFSKRPRGFTRVPNAVTRALDLDFGPKLLLIYLLSFAWGDHGCCVGQRRIAKELRIDVRTVRRHLKRLIDDNVLTIRRQGPASRTTYELNLGRFIADTDDPPPGNRRGNGDRRCETNPAPSGEAILTSEILQYDENTSANNSDGREARYAESAQLLLSFGINEPTRSELAVRYLPDEIRSQIAWMAHRRVRDQHAALVSALRERWAEPAAARDARERTERRRLEEARAAEAGRLVESVSVAPHAREASRRIGAQMRYAFWDRAREALGGKLGAARYGAEQFDKMVAKYALFLIGESSQDEAS